MNSFFLYLIALINTLDAMASYFPCGGTAEKPDAWCTSRQRCKVDAGKHSCECLPGYTGKGRNCVPYDECANDYPCPGIKDVTSYCVDDFPPKKYKCQCLLPYVAVLPDKNEVVDPVPVEWRPLACIKRENQDEDIDPDDECAMNYPCAGIKDVSSYCVDYFPPEKYKCQCLPPYVALLPDEKDLVDPVPPEWRPLSCIKEKTPEDDIITLIPDPTLEPTQEPTPDPTFFYFCNDDNDCTGANKHCVRGFCVCQDGYFSTNGLLSANCVDEEECANDLDNCHRFATCTNTDGSFYCTCNEGYKDADSSADSGIKCVNRNECEEQVHNCPDEQQCIDRNPPLFFECVDPTDPPTQKPTASPIVPTSNNFVKNGGFEGTTVGDDWNLDGYTLSSNEKYSGTQSIYTNGYLLNEASQTGMLGELPQGTTLTFSASSKPINVGSPSTYYEVLLQVAYSDGMQESALRLPFDSTIFEWQRVIGSYTVPSAKYAVTYRVFCRYGNSGTAPGVAYFDDIELLLG